jgi:hypothetical protein
MRYVTVVAALAACLAAAPAPAAEPQPTIAMPAQTPVSWEQSRARAIGAVMAGYAPARWDEALAALDEADAATIADPFWRRSFLPGNQLLRGYIQARRGHREQAVAAARAATAARPYAAEIASLAARIELRATNDMDAYLANLRAAARFDPNRITQLYLYAIMRGDYEAAVDLYRHVMITIPVHRGSYLLVDGENRAMEALLMRTELAGTNAYARAALGQTEGAEQALAAADAGIERALARPAGEPVRIWPEVRQVRAMTRRRGEADAVVARWRNLVALRLHPADPATATAAATLLAGSRGFDPVLLDLARAVRAAQPGNGVISADLIALLEARLPAVLERYTAVDDQAVLGSLPPVETADRMPEYDEGAHDTLRGSDAGYSTLPGPVPGSQTVRFVSSYTTPVSMGEIALMRAAELARERGMHGFIVLARRLIPLTTTFVGGPNNGVSRESGHDLEVDVLFVDPGALPRGYETAGWRVVDADALWTIEQPIYVAERERLRAETRAQQRAAREAERAAGRR